jgi:hypothetical protein
MQTGTRLLSGGRPASPAEIPGRLEEVRRRIADACGRCGRDPAGVTLVAVGKTVDLERLRRALDCGVRDLGENRVQEAEEKVRALGHGEGGRGPIWHMVGHLQSNKAARAAELFDWIHGVDSAQLGERIDRAAVAAGRRVDILLQVNLSGEPTKSGVRPEEAAEVARQLSRLRAARLRGLMAIPAPLREPEAMRPSFRALRELRDAIVRGGGVEGPLAALSMGMSEDFEVAIEEGATHIRVGRAIFGDRPAAGPPQ